MGSMAWKFEKRKSLYNFGYDINRIGLTVVKRCYIREAAILLSSRVIIEYRVPVFCVRAF